MVKQKRFASVKLFKDKDMFLLNGVVAAVGGFNIPVDTDLLRSCVNMHIAAENANRLTIRAGQAATPGEKGTLEAQAHTSGAQMQSFQNALQFIRGAFTAFFRRIGELIRGMFGQQ